MATIKSYTDISQSRKLAVFLPLESADMSYIGEDNALAVDYLSVKKEFDATKEVDVFPCWSLAALLGTLPKSLIYTTNPTLDGYCCKNIMHDLETYGDNPVDACYEMLLKLHELNLL